MEPTLDEIKNYILSNNISLDEKNTEERVLDIFGEIDNLEYYKYYLNHSEEINDWLLNLEEYNL